MPPSCCKKETARASKSRLCVLNEAEYEVQRELGKGHFGVVLLVRRRSSNAHFGWKRFETAKVVASARSGGRIMELLEREIQIHQSLDHPNILPFLDYAISTKYVTLVLAYADRGDLFQYTMHNCRTGLDRIHIFHQTYPAILSAVAYLEKLQIAHRDIKPENILLRTTEKNDIQPQLCDFGWAVRYFKAGTQQSTMCGTPEYVPPELLVKRRYRQVHYAAEFVDPWALGVLAVEILLGETPFHVPESQSDAEKKALIYAKIRRFQKLDQSIYSRLDKLASRAFRKGSRGSFYVDLIMNFMQPTPGNRASAAECLEQYSQIFGFSASTILPSVKQRRQIFQRNYFSLSSALLS